MMKIFKINKFVYNVMIIIILKIIFVTKEKYQIV